MTTHSLCRDPLNVGVHGRDAFRALDGQFDESIVAPLGPPRVLNQPIRRGSGRFISEPVAAVVLGRIVEGRFTGILRQFFCRAVKRTSPAHFRVAFEIDTH